jgi:hypothetical protein
MDPVTSNIAGFRFQLNTISISISISTISISISDITHDVIDKATGQEHYEWRPWA